MADTGTYADALDIIGEVKPRTPTLTAVEQVQQRDLAERSSQPTAEDLMVEQAKSPGMETEVRAEQSARMKNTERQREAKYVAENREPGVPLDVETGLDAGTRAKMSFERNDKKREEWLAQQPGIESVRKTKNGDGVIARVKAEDGSMRDVLVDERRMTLKDFADIAGDLPQVATSALLAYATGGMGLLGQAATVGAGTALEGAAQDVIARKASGRPVDAGEIAASRGGQAVFDTALPLIPGGAKRLAQVAVGPFSKSVGPLEREAVEAAKRLDVPLTAAQQTGSKAVARVETFTKELPFGTPLVEQAKKQEVAINDVREYLLGGKPADVPSNQEIADKVGNVLGSAKTSDETNLARKTAIGEAEGQQNIEDLLQKHLPVGNVAPSEAGEAVRKKIVAQRDAFKAQATIKYNNAYSQPGAEAEFVPSAPIKDLVEEIRGKTTEATQQLLPEIKRIFKVGDTIPDKMTLRQAVELRSVIGDMVGRPEALPGIPTGYLKRLYAAASDAIDEGVKAAPNPEIGRALKEAQTYYKDNFWKFEQPGVADLFAEVSPGKGYKVGDSDIARRLTSGRGDVDQLKVMGQMLGQNSSEYKQVLRSSLNEMMEQSKFGRDTIDAGDFLSRLKGMSPEFRKQAIGPIERELVGDAKVLELMQGKKVDPLDMERILNARPGKVADTVREIASEQDYLDKTYGTRIMRQLTDGQFSPKTFNPDDFVARFVDNASEAELKQVMTGLRAADPKIPEMIKKRAMADLLNKTATEVSPTSVVTGEITGFDYKKLLASLDGPTGEKYKTLLGADAIDTLKDLTVVEAARAKAASMGKQSGQLVYSNILAALMDFKLGEIPRIAKNRILAGMLTTPGLKTWLTSSAKIPATPNARFAVMTSPPVIRTILDEFSDEPDLAGQVIDAIKSSPDSGQARPEPKASALDIINRPSGDDLSGKK